MSRHDEHGLRRGRLEIEVSSRWKESNGDDDGRDHVRRVANEEEESSGRVQVVVERDGK